MGKKTVVERMLANSLSLPSSIWKRLNTMWAVFFISVGCINVYVMYHYDTDAWVTFKTFGVPGLMVVFIVLQLALIYKHIPDTKE